MNKRKITIYIDFKSPYTYLSISPIKKLAKEFNNVQKSYNPKEVFFISDGVNEREIKPIIESRVPIVSIKRVAT